MHARVLIGGSVLVLAMLTYGTTAVAACYLGNCDSLGYYETPPTYGYVGSAYRAYGYAAPVYRYSATVYRYPRYYGARRYYAPARYYGPRRSYFYRAGVTRVGWRRW
jgi:hypothetical protein